MIQKIKNSCKKKGVPEKYAERIQKTFKIEKEESIDASVDLFKDNILPAITEAENEAKSAAETSAVAEYEKKYKLKDGKPVEDKPQEPTQGNPPEKTIDGMSPEMKAYLDEMKASFTAAIDEMKKSSAASVELQNRETAKGLLQKAGLPESWISRVDVMSADKSMEDQVKTLGEEFTKIRQDAINDAVANGEYSPGSSAQLQDRSVEDWSKFMNGESSTPTSSQVGVVDLGVKH